MLHSISKDVVRDLVQPALNRLEAASRALDRALTVSDEKLAWTVAQHLTVVSRWSVEASDRDLIRTLEENLPPISSRDVLVETKRRVDQRIAGYRDLLTELGIALPCG